MNWPINQPLNEQRDKAGANGQFRRIALKLPSIYCSFFAALHHAVNSPSAVLFGLVAVMRLKIVPGRLSCLIITRPLGCAVIVLIGVFR